MGGCRNTAWCSAISRWPVTRSASVTVGYVAPVGTPVAIVQRLNTAINTAMRQPDVLEKLGSAGLIVVTEPPAYFDNAIRSDYAKYGKLVKDIGFVPQ